MITTLVKVAKDSIHALDGYVEESMATNGFSFGAFAYILEGKRLVFALQTQSFKTHGRCSTVALQLRIVGDRNKDICKV